MGLLQDVFGLIKEPTNEDNKSEERLGDRRSFGYHVADNLLGFDDAYETRGEKFGKAVGQGIEQVLSDPVGTGKAIATGVYNSIEKGMAGPMAFYTGPDYQEDPFGNPVGTEQEVVDVNKALNEAQQDYYMNALELTAGIGAGGLSASKVLTKPDPDGEYAGLFYNTHAIKGNSPEKVEYKNALDMEKAGASEKDIWKKTGWTKLFGEWVRETDDSLTYTKNMETSGVAAKNLGVEEPKPKKPSPIVTAFVKVHKQKKAIQARYQEMFRQETVKQKQGLITQIELESIAKDLEAKMELELDAITGTKQTIIPDPAPQPIPQSPINKNLKKEGLLDEVLGNIPPETEKILNHPNREFSAYGGSTGANVYAESGLNTSSNYLGVYGQDGGKIKAFKATKINSVRNPQDKADLAEYQSIRSKYGPDDARTKEAQAALMAKQEWSTLLHETQHYIDDVFRSKSGRGSNTSSAKDRKAAKAWAKDEYKKEMAEIKANYKKGSEEYLDAVRDLDLSPVGRANKPSTKGGYTNFQYYTRDAGETKARLVQARRNMSAEERKNETPQETLKKLGGYTQGGNYPTTPDEVFTLVNTRDYYDIGYKPLN